MNKNEAIDEFWFRFRRQFFRKIFSAFKSSGLSQKILAERIGKDPARVNKWLRGDANITLRTLYIMSRAIGFRPEINLVPLSSLKKANHFHDAHTLHNLSYPEHVSTGSKVTVNMGAIPGYVPISAAVLTTLTPRN